MNDGLLTVLVENTAGKMGLIAEHGLSFWIELDGRKILFDTGQGNVLAHNARRLGIECLVCLGGGGTQKNALQLSRAGLPVLTLPKTIDNDVAETDITFGFDSAMSIATEAIDRLHTTATSHNRLIVCEVMGHNAGWLALGAGIAGGADVILTPEIPYDLGIVAEHLFERRRHGKRFSIIVVAEGARSRQEADAAAQREKEREKERKKQRKAREADAALPAAARPEERPEDDVYLPRLVQEPTASRLARQLQELTGTEARVTSLGHVQRGGIPSATDRLLCTRLGIRAAQLLAEGHFDVMVAVRGAGCEPVALEKVAGARKLVPAGHPWLETARLVGTCLGDA